MIQKYLATTTAKLILFGIIALVLFIAIKSCTGQRERAIQAGQDARSANATAATAKDVAETVIKRADSDASVDTLVRDTAKQIDELPPTEASRAARRAICQMPAYVGDPQCAK